MNTAELSPPDFESAPDQETQSKRETITSIGITILDVISTTEVPEAAATWTANTTRTLNGNPPNDQDRDAA